MENKAKDKNGVNATLDSGNTVSQTKYQQNGLTVVSNDNFVVPRDESGNIALEEGGTNPLLIIEPMTTKITTISMLKVLDTRFQYFKFPATTRVIDDTEVVLDLDLDLTTDITPTEDITYARYKPENNQRIQRGNPTAGEDIRPSGIEISDVADGIPQTNINKYYVTKEVKSAGIDLRFRIKIQHRFDSATAPKSTAYFFISKNGPNTYGERKNYLGPFVGSSPRYPEFGFIGQYEIQNTFIDVEIPNSNFEAGDYFGITAFSGAEENNAFHTILAEQTYWVITDASKNVDLWNQEIK